ncbi:MAG TPA: hypothetical protein VNP04_05970 [Alphaproteobacteria bacterium]|nr:hypothetical protein [Alphaproteobacteria bacterium]
MGTMHVAFPTSQPVGLVEIHTVWAPHPEMELERIFRTLRIPMKERAEIFEFHYHVKPKGGPAALALLWFHQPWHIQQTSAGLQIQTVRYFIYLNVSASPGVNLGLEKLPNGADQVLIATTEGPCDITIGVLIHSAEKRARDPVHFLVPAALDTATFLACAMAPGLFQVPLSRRPRYAVTRFCPTLFALHEQKGVSFRHLMQRLFWPSQPQTVEVPEAVPFLVVDTIRSAQALVARWCPAVAHALPPLIEGLRHLPLERASSLQLITLLYTSEAEFAEIQTFTASIGMLHLRRIERDIPEECRFAAVHIAEKPAHLQNALRELDRLFESIVLHPTIESRRQFYPDEPLPPIAITTNDDLALSPFLAAGRLRAEFTMANPACPARPAWPRPLSKTSTTASAAQIARYVLADLLTDATLREPAGDAGSTYEDLWRLQLHNLEHGASHAERLVFCSIGDQYREFDRMKLLSALLYTGKVAASLLPMSISPQQERRVLAALAKLAKPAADACVSVWRSGGTKLSDRFATDLGRRQHSLQQRFDAVIPPEFVQLLRETKPKEIVNFSALPLEWMQVDGVPLAYLSKVTNIRPARLHVDAQASVDIAATYTSLVSDDFRPSSADFRVLIIAPDYGSGEQRQVSQYVESFASALARRLETQRQQGRDIEYRILREVYPDSLRQSFHEQWSLIVYAGHAHMGKLVLPGGLQLSPRDLPARTFYGEAVLLIGCDTQATANAAGSVASQLLSLGARGVFATYFPIHLDFAHRMFFLLLDTLIDENVPYGDGLQLMRGTAFYDYCLRFFAQATGRTLKEGVHISWPIEVDYLRYRDGWDRLYRDVLAEWQGPLASTPGVSSDAIVRPASLAGLALSFTGDLRGRLFEF